MRVLLLSMPDSFEHTPTLAIRMPNGALTSLAGNIDEHHQVVVADLVLTQKAVRATVEQLLRVHVPDIVGLSVMTFQRATARRLISLIRSRLPEVFIVVGGYDPSLAPEAWTHPAVGVDAIVRGEGELTFRELIRAIERATPLSEVNGLWYRARDGFVRTPPRPISAVEEGTIAPPNRRARALTGYTMLGRQVDVVETSRGCTFDCSFCSIIEMRGRNFHRFPIPRVIADIADARRHGARVIFIVDDNITLDVQRFTALCKAIIEAGLTDLDYMVQGMTSAVAAHGRELAPLMRKAGFRYVFLGIENILDDDLAFLKAGAKNATRDAGRRTGNASEIAIDILHRHGMFVIGGLIVGSPDDTPDAIAANLAFARRHVDWPYIQHPTPYPGTPMTREFVERDLIVSRRVEEYDGTTAVTRTAHLPAGEVEFLRWKAERWMKLRHLPAVLRHDPGFVVRNGHRMLAHTFRGTTWRSVLGLERARDVFRRYRAIRERERDYVDWPDPLSGSPAASHAAIPPASSLTFVNPSR